MTSDPSLNQGRLPGICDGRKVITHDQVVQFWRDGCSLMTRSFPAALNVDLPYRLSASAFDSRMLLDKKGFYMKKKRARDSVNGQFIPLEEAKKRPRETTVETVKKPERRKTD
ncbi:competence protein CinA [Pseudomonas tremae]|uniref:Competence protein CinA n=1 Tax=Pseudomonas tremae TaxID=200454 RepID=A0ABV4PKQ8_9PSED|nr:MULTISPECIES: hypothetical protein [Pseudomonas syringae group]KGS15276.1 hypothetical protein OA77_06605 [Pseudomonas coronafaciens]